MKLTTSDITEHAHHLEADGCELFVFRDQSALVVLPDGRIDFVDTFSAWAWLKNRGLHALCEAIHEHDFSAKLRDCAE